MNETKMVFEVLKRALKAQGKTYADVAVVLNLSEPSVKRLFSEKNMSLERLAAICSWLDTSISEIVRAAGSMRTAGPEYLTEEQENELIRNSGTFVYFCLLLADWKPNQIRREYKYTENEATRILIDLDKIGVIELHAKNKVKLLIGPKLEWIPDGPVRRMYEENARSEFFHHPFKENNDRLCFRHWEVTLQTKAIMSRKIDKFINELDEIAEIDEAVSKGQTDSVGLLLGFRGWVFSLFEKHRR